MSVVYKPEDTHLDRFVTLKFLLKTLSKIAKRWNISAGG